MVQAEIVYRGRVQGVGFRATVRHAASTFQVTGWVRNEPDGTVSMVARGQPSEVEQLLEEIQRRMGRFITRVDRMNVPVTSQAEETGFEIRR